MYHIQVGNSWNPKTVCETLRSHCVDSSIVGKCIQIRLPDGKRQTTLQRVLEFLSLRRSKYISLNYDPTKFIRNVNLEDSWPGTRIDLRCFDDIDSAMLKLGCRVGGDREIAAQYCPENATLTGLFDEIDRLQLKIDQSILVQDFDNAGMCRDDENLIRNRIDAILFGSVLKSRDEK